MRLLCRKIGEITVMNKHLRKFLLLLPCLLLHPEGSRAITVDIPAGEVVSGGDVHSVVTQRVYGEADNFTVLGKQQVMSGGVTRNSNIYPYGQQDVLQNGISYGTVVQQYAVQNVDGRAYSSSVGSYGTIDVNAGGYAEDTSVDGGSFFVSSGGTAEGTVIASGHEYISGTDNNAKVSGGVGNMGGAILKGIEGKLGNTAVFAYDANPEKLADLRLVGATAAGSAREIAEKCDFILLAVKPQHLGEVLAEIKDSVKPETVFISICAGISAEFIRERTIPNAKVVLVMPNTPMMLGCGASAMSHDETVSEDEFAFARKVIGSCGITEVIPTDKMKEIIAVNGSSPAFIYLYAKGFVDYADSVGIDKDVALRLFAQSLIGSAKMLTESGMTVDELIKQVSSPGGTTLAGLDKLYEGDLTGDVKNACEACTKRAYELGQ